MLSLVSHGRRMQPYNFVDNNILAGVVYNGPITARPKDSSPSRCRTAA